jgi:hypothetical protein
MVQGRTELRRIGRWRFPVHHLVQDDAVVARLGRFGWLRVFLGPGVRVELSDGSRWRIRATTIRGKVCPVVVDSERRRVAMAEKGNGTYGITGRDYGYALNPGHAPRRATATWTVRYYEDLVGEVRRRPLRFEALEPVHIGAVLLSFVLMRYGLPDDMAPRLPAFRWR